MSKNSRYMTIAEFAHEHGLTMRTLRLYEERKLITPYRVGTARYYFPKDAIRLQLLLKGKRMGLTLAEIEALFDSIFGDGTLVDDDAAEINIATALSPDKIGGIIRLLEKRREETLRALEDLKEALRKADSGEPARSVAR